MKVGKEEDVKKMLQEAKIFVSMLDETVTNLNDAEVNNYRSILKISK
jgi:hypothetical protein